MADPDPLRGALHLGELEGLAEGVLDPVAFDYIAGGAGDESNLRANRDAWARYRFLPRALVDVSERTLATTMLGERVAMPIAVAPTAFHRLCHEEGERATASGAGAAGALFIASTLSTTPLEDVSRACTGPRWFQLYVYRDRKLTEALVDRAERAGFSALVLTVDAPVWGQRWRDTRNAFTLPDGLTLANFIDLPQEALPAGGGDGLAAYVASQLDPSLSWADVDWLASITDLPIVVKGLVHPADARLAVEHGCAGVVVSNHGGRQLDAGVATIDALAGVVEAVDGAAEVYIDGGVRRGSHVLLALAMGARGVLVGRPTLWGLALGGAAGVTAVLERLAGELDNAMALCGVTSVEDVGVSVRGPL